MLLRHEATLKTMGIHALNMKRPVIGFVCPNIAVGVDFYQKFEGLMAKLWPDEKQRPIIYAEFGLNANAKPDFVDGKHCDFLFKIPAKATLQAASRSGKSGELLAKLMNQSTLAGSDKSKLLSEMLALFASLEEYVPSQLLLPDTHTAINVLGGMGPIACAHFLKSLSNSLEETNLSAKTTIKLYSNPEVPGHYNISGIWNKIRHLIDYILRFREFVNHSQGLLVAPSNTFHLLLPGLKFITLINEKILHIVKQVETKMFEIDAKSVAIMSTDKTVNHELYEHIFAGSDKKIFTLKDYPDQKLLVQQGIDLVKAGKAAAGGSIFEQVIDFIKKTAPEAPIVLGCTEIIIGCKAIGMEIKHPLYDSADILAHATAQQALLSPNKQTHEMVAKNRDFAHFFSSAVETLVRFKNAHKHLSSYSEPLIEALSKILKNKRLLNQESYHQALSAIIASGNSTNSSYFKNVLGEIIYQELGFNFAGLSTAALLAMKDNITTADPNANVPGLTHPYVPGLTRHLGNLGIELRIHGCRGTFGLGRWAVHPYVPGLTRHLGNVAAFNPYLLGLFPPSLVFFKLILL